MQSSLRNDRLTGVASAESLVPVPDPELLERAEKSGCGCGSFEVDPANQMRGRV